MFSIPRVGSEPIGKEYSIAVKHKTKGIEEDIREVGLVHSSGDVG